MLPPSQLEKIRAAYNVPFESSHTIYDSPFLHVLVSTQRDQLPNLFTERVCLPGEVIFREDEVGDTMYMIWSGRVAVLKGDDASPTILGYRGAGEIIGEMALLENRPRSATLVALDNLRLLGITREKFHQLLLETPTVSLSIMETLSSRLRKSDEFLIESSVTRRELSDQVTNLTTEKQRLEELQRVRQETADLILHDLRNPLSTMVVAIKMLEAVLPEEIGQANQDIFSIIDSSSNRLKRLVLTLLDTSRLEEGADALVATEFDMAELIRTIVDRAKFVNPKNIDLQTIIPASLPPITADRDKIERVLTNLLDNAMKYTLEKGRITLATRVEGGLFYTSVTDTGTGIPPEAREHIFDRFAQAPGEKQKKRGFGLGLAFCRLTVEAHGGKIWVEAGEDGTGSRFVFTLPQSPPHP